MNSGPEDQWRPPEPPGQKSRPGAPKSGRPRWLPLLIVGLAVLALLAWQSTTSGTTSKARIEYSEFMKMANDGKVQSIDYEASSGRITGKLRKDAPAID